MTWLWGVAAGALILRLLMVWVHHAQGWMLRDDAYMYLTLARNLEHGVFSMFHPSDIPDTIKRPGYPFVIHLANTNVLSTLLIQCLLSSLKVPLCYMLARELGVRPDFALLSAGLIAIEPVDILLSTQLLSETLFGCAFLAGLWLVVRPGRWRDLLCAAILFGTCAWIRPVGPAMILVVGILLALVLRRSLVRSLTFVATALFVLMPWVLRNQQVMGRAYLGDSAVVATSYFQAQHVLNKIEPVRAIERSKALDAQAAAMDWEDRPAYHAFFDAQRADVWRIWRSHPFVWTAVHLKKIMEIIVAPGRGHIALFFDRDGLPGMLFLAVSLVYSTLSIGAFMVLLTLWRSTPPGLRALMVVAICVIGMGALTTSDARFKNPVMPVLITITVWGGQQWYQRRKLDQRVV